MHRLFEAILQYADKVEDREIYCVAARAPGSLGQSIPMDPGHRTDWLIGSISMKIHLETTCSVYSVFIFATGQVKISGGSHGYTGTDDPTAYNHFLESTVIRPILSIPVLSTYLGELRQWKLFLLNGTTLLTNANRHPSYTQLGSYRQLCDRIAHSINQTGGKPDSILSHVIMPPIMVHPVYHQPCEHDPARVSYIQSQTNGRICSISIKCVPRGTIRFDHKGSVQFLGFRSMSDMGQAMHALLGLLHACEHTADLIPIDTTTSITNNTEAIAHTINSLMTPTRRPSVRRRHLH